MGFGTDIDITDLRRVQEAALSRQKLESLGVLAGGIAHDFNNLLGSILANAELLISQLPVDLQFCDDAENIRTVASRAAEIVAQMMAYSGEEGAEFESVNVSQLVAEMLQLLRVSITKRAVLRVSLPGLPEKLPAVSANAAQRRQVVMNLITNASQAIGETGGVISVTTSEVRIDVGPPEGNAPGLPFGNYVRLQVSDTGCGMTEEVRGRMSIRSLPLNRLVRVWVSRPCRVSFGPTTAQLTSQVHQAAVPVLRSCYAAKPLGTGMIRRSPEPPTA